MSRSDLGQIHMIDYEKAKEETLKDVARFMVVAARTAPKARGRDNLEIIIVDSEKEKKSLIEKMKEIARRDNRPSFERDAGNIDDTKYLVIIGTKTEALGLNCGFCGYKDCAALAKAKGICAYNAMDLGIAIGSAASTAARFHVDNRIMYSLGKAAMEAGLLSADVRQAIGIPLSATGKNPFFDRAVSEGAGK